VYSNIGQSFVSFAAPGGADDLPGIRTCTLQRIPAGSGAISNPCWVFDMVLSPVSGTGSYNWADGTSMAAPAAAGVAALIWGKYGPMTPAKLEGMLRNSASDLGKSGNDDFYGAGFLDAGAAVK
jgi:subtilisin family serine protease